MALIPVIIGFLLFSGAIYAEDAELLKQLATANESLTTVTGTFTQKTSRADDIGIEPRIMHATFAIEFPDHYDLVFTRPEDSEWRQRLCSEGTKFWTIEQSFSDTPPDVTVTPVDHHNEELERIFAYLRFDVLALEQNFIVSAEATVAERVPVVTLLPKIASSSNPEKIIVNFDKSLHVQRLQIYDAQENITEITLDSSVYGEPIPPERFLGE